MKTTLKLAEKEVTIKAPWGSIAGKKFLAVKLYLTLSSEHRTN